MPRKPANRRRLTSNFLGFGAKGVGASRQVRNSLERRDGLAVQHQPHHVFCVSVWEVFLCVLFPCQPEMSAHNGSWISGGIRTG